MTTTGDEWTDAFQRLAEAITRREPRSLALVFDLSARIDRHPPAPRGGVSQPVETFAGLAEITHWLLRAPSGTKFELVGQAELGDDGTGSIEYVVILGDFRNGGRWCARLTDDARFVWWAHQPFTLGDG